MRYDNSRGTCIQSQLQDGDTMLCEYLCTVQRSGGQESHAWSWSHLAKVSVMYALLQLFRGGNSKENTFHLRMKWERSRKVRVGLRGLSFVRVEY